MGEEEDQCRHEPVEGRHQNQLHRDIGEIHPRETATCRLCGELYETNTSMVLTVIEWDPQNRIDEGLSEPDDDRDERETLLDESIEMAMEEEERLGEERQIPIRVRRETCEECGRVGYVEIRPDDLPVEEFVSTAQDGRELCDDCMPSLERPGNRMRRNRTQEG